jgi:hypothetical protein
MKYLSIVCATLALMVAVPFSSPAATYSAALSEGGSNRNDAGLMLRPLVQISSQEVLLRDVVIGISQSDVRGEIFICKSPSRGQVRTLRASEITAVLAHSGLNAEFIGGLRTSIVRTGHKIAVQDLRPLIETALKAANPTATIGEVQLQAEISLSEDPGIVLRKLKFDSTTQRYRAFFVATKEPGKINFEATATLASGTASSEISFANPSGRVLHAALLVHRGQPAQMQVSGDGFNATLPVVCFEDGDSGKIVRVRERTSKKNYRAEVIAKDMLRAIQLEN